MAEAVAGSGAIVAYRWFQVEPGGRLSGAQGMEWPADQPMRATHLVMFDDGGATLRNLMKVVAVGALLFAGAFVAGLVLLVWLLATGHHAAMSWTGAIMDLVGSAWALIVTVGMLVMAPRPAPGEDHRCPGPPRRLIGRFTPPCGIYAYHEMDDAIRGTRGAFVAAHPLVIARVAMWGKVYEHRWGYRSEYARVEALYDDGRGHVELAAAVYGVPTEPLTRTLPATPGVFTLRGLIMRRLFRGSV